MSISLQSSLRYRYAVIIIILTFFYFLTVLISSKKHYKADENFSTSIECNREFIPKLENSKFEELIKKTKTISQSDPRLLHLIRSKYIHPPSRLPYPKDFKDPSHWQSKFVLNLLKGKRNGFFVEAGAFDGEWYSNTLLMEKDYGWRGILVEPSAQYFLPLLEKHRKAWFVPACLSPDQYPVELDLKFKGVGTQLTQTKEVGDQLVQCFPLFSILLAVKKTDIDYFSLDVEKVEMKVLESIPWDQVRIKVLSVENQFFTEQDNKTLYNLMDSLGYKELEKYPAKPPRGDKVIDNLFYHPIYINS